MAQVDTTYGTYRSAPLFIPEVIADLIDTKLIDNIVFAPLAMIDNTLAAGAGDTVKLPYYGYIGMASDVSEGYDIPLAKLTQTTTSVTVEKYGKAIQITDEAALSGYGDPVGEGTNQLITSIADKVDAKLLAALAANSASEQNYTGASTGLVPADIPKALAKYGEDNDGQKALLVTPDFYSQLLGSDWIPASEIAADVKIRGSVGMAYGCQVIVSNRLVSSGNLYIVKPKTLAIFMKRDTFVEVDRDILNESTVIKASKICAPYLLNPKGMIKLSKGS